MLVEQFNGALEAGEFHPEKAILNPKFLQSPHSHCVRDLAHPKRGQPLVEAHDALGAHDERGATTEGGRCRWGSLNAHLDRLHRGQHHVREEFGTGACRQVQAGPVGEGQFLKIKVFQ